MIDDGTRFGRLLVWTKRLFTPLALAFLLGAFWQSRLILSEILAHSLPQHLLLAFLLMMFAHLISPFFASIILQRIGSDIHYRETLDLHLRYLPARYLPGGIWFSVARVNHLYSLRVTPRNLCTLMVFENLIALGVTLSAGGFLVITFRQGDAWGNIAFPVALFGMLLLILLPFLVNRWVLAGNGRITLRCYVHSIVLSVLFWSCTSFAFLLFVLAFPGTFESVVFLEIIGAYLLSWGIGFLAVFAPQGVGVFEVVAADLLPMILTFTAQVALFAGFRLLVLFADTFMWMGWTIMKLIRRI